MCLTTLERVSLVLRRVRARGSCPRAQRVVGTSLLGKTFGDSLRCAFARYAREYELEKLRVNVEA
jgi:hypothetical protein